MTFLNCFKFKFTPSKFEFCKDQLGNLESSSSWLRASLIVNDEEANSLAKMTQFSNGILLYRASTDGFTSQAFHAKCDGKGETITIINTDANYVFGGYASSAWNSNCDYIADNNAFIFSLRRNGFIGAQKFIIKDPTKALIGHSSYGPIFGGGNGNAFNVYIDCHVYEVGYEVGYDLGYNRGYNYNFNHGYNSGLEFGCDIFITSNSNTSYVCEANIGQSYECPVDHIYGQQNTIDYLAGGKKNWLTTEIEVYQIIRN